MPEPKEIGHQVKFSKTLVGLFKRGCWEIPEIMATSAIALIGVAMGVCGVMKYKAMDGDNTEFKKTYIIVRPDDPRASRFKNPSKTKF